MRDQTLARVKDLAVTAGAVVTVLAGLLAALDYMLEAKLDAKLEPVQSEITSIREDLRAMNERHERRFVRLENLLVRLENVHLASSGPRPAGRRGLTLTSRRPRH